MHLIVTRLSPLCLALLLGSAVAQEMPAEKVSRGEDRSAVAVTIYNDSLALIREERTLPLDKGLNRIALREVSAQIRPETASLRSLGGAPLQLLEQNFDFDLLTPQKLLDKYVGKTVTIVRTSPHDGKESRQDATVLSNNSGIVLQYADRIEAGIPTDARILYKDLPANLRDRPTLVVDLQSEKSGAQKAELSYLSGGLGWKADYVATLAQNESTLDLAGWVTLTNQSGTTYENARLQMVAGDVNRVKEDMARGKVMYETRAVAAPAASPMEREALFEYHLYSLARPTTLRNQQTKQVALLNAANVPVRKEYRMQGADYWFRNADENTPERGEKRQVEVFVEFDNKGGDLGQPMPQGTVRVYKSDRSGSPQFIGEDRIEHTPRNEKIRLKLGKAFDVTGLWKRKNFTRISSNTFESDIQIELNNAKDIPVTVRVVEPMPGTWKMQKESHPHQKTTASTATWDIAVPADGKAVLDYRVRITW